GSQFVELGIFGSEYLTYIATIPFNFYSILALLLVFIIIWTKWDFGPMAQAEYRARTTGQLTRPGATPPTDEEEEEVAAVEEQHMKKRDMVVPIVVLLSLILPMFLLTGGYSSLGIVIASDNSNGVDSTAYLFI